jgi:hypothetical protein
MGITSSPVVKYEGSVPKTLRAFCDRNAGKVKDVLAGGGYNTDSGFGYDVSLRAGWRKGDERVHTIVEQIIADMLSRLRCVVPCDCDDCARKLAKLNEN